MKTNIPPEQLGNTETILACPGYSVSVMWAVIEHGAALVSNSLNGAINELYPAELQPRDRTTPESVNKIGRLSGSLKFANLNKSKFTSDGAPILGQDMVTESGNGRVMAIRKAYAEGSAADYREKLVATSEQFGIKQAVVEALSHPMLVRIRLSDVDREQFARDCNWENDTKSQGARPFMESIEEKTFHVVKARLSNATSTAAVKRTIVEFLLMSVDDVSDQDAAYQRLVNILVTAASKRDFLFLVHGLTLHQKIKKSVGPTALSDAELAEKLFGSRASANWINILGTVGLDTLKIAEAVKQIASGDLKRAQKGSRSLTGRYPIANATPIGLVNYLAGTELASNDYQRAIFGELNPALFSDEFNAMKANGKSVADSLLENIPTVGTTEIKATLSKLIDSYFTAIGEKPKGDMLEDLRLTVANDLLTNFAQQIEAAKIKFATSKSRKEAAKWEREIARIEAKKNKAWQRFQSLDGMKRFVNSWNKFEKNGTLPDPRVFGLRIYAECTKAQKAAVPDSVVDRVESFLTNAIDEHSSIAPSVLIDDQYTQRKLIESGVMPQEVRKNIAEICRLVGGNVPDDIELVYTGSRASCQYLGDKVRINIGSHLSKGTTWHEIGHAIEDSNPGVKQLAFAELRRRAAIAPRPKIASLHDIPSHRFRKDEYYVNYFLTGPYESKFYVHGEDVNKLERLSATELISTGFELLSDREGIRMLARHREYFELIMAAVKTLNEDPKQ
ncbi:hypothetical protein [Shewanella algae]|uniref:hypothetical protein n=1 Tax=Shewanella algae TaxID=38313 RepID=UPI00300460C8